MSLNVSEYNVETFQIKISKKIGYDTLSLYVSKIDTCIHHFLIALLELHTILYKKYNFIIPNINAFYFAQFKFKTQKYSETYFC